MAAVARAHAEQIDMSQLQRKLLDKLDRAAKDLPNGARTQLRNALNAVLEAHEEDKEEEGRRDPQPKSFDGLLQFICHPNRADWAPPSLALNPEGNFVAIWSVSGDRYSVEFPSTCGANWIAIVRGSDTIQRYSGHYDCFDRYEAPPMPIVIPSRR